MSNPTELPVFTADDVSMLESVANWMNRREASPERASELFALAKRVQAARRAQPEGEAPQADAAVMVPKFEGQFDSHQDWVNRAQRVLSVPSHKPSAICVDAKGRRCHIGADMKRASEEGTFPVRYFWECELATPAATLSPLCGAQHAESGKEAAVKRALELYAESYDSMSRMGDGKVASSDVAYDIDSNMIPSVLKALAAQQAAAPGLLNDLRDGYSSGFFASGPDDGDHRFTLHYDTAEQAEEAFMAVTSAIESSAPGTPEAPKGSIGDLTEFHVLLNWYDNEASYGSINEGRNKLTEYIDKWADRRAAQLDGGQEGSDRG